MKKIILLIIALIIAIIAASCKTTKLTASVSERIQIDTVRDTTVIVKFHAVHDTLTIDNPCDSTGILNTFYSKIKLPQGQIIIRSLRGKIQATVNIDSIQSVYKNMYRAKENNLSQISTKIVAKTEYPAWLVTSFVFETLIILGYIYLKLFHPTTWYRAN
jgi:hypothetical protein